MRAAMGITTAPERCSTTTSPDAEIPTSQAATRSDADLRARRLFWLLVMAWLLNLMDLSYTLLAHKHDLLHELNPLAASVLPYGPLALVAYKVGFLLLGTTILWICRQHRLTEGCLWAYTALCLGLAFWWQRVVAEAAPILAPEHLPAPLLGWLGG